jgi:hypothetical protein
MRWEHVTSVFVARKTGIVMKILKFSTSLNLIGRGNFVACKTRPIFGYTKVSKLR